MAERESFRFRPRYTGLAYAALAVGAALLAAAFALSLTGASLAFAAACGIAGIALGALYLASPAWRFRVDVDDDGLEVLDGRGARRFRVAWDSVAKVIASPSTRTCVLDGGGPERTLIVPGPGATAPYAIERRAELYETIVRSVPPAAIEEVELVENAMPRAREPLDAGAETGAGLEARARRD
jgi:hypothetical protein